MKYSIKAHAIEYLGVTFRSKLEAMCYDYLLSTFDPSKGYKIEYEPKILRSLWPIDFAVYKDDHLIHIVEVKPNTRMFDVIKYLITSNQIDTLPTVYCMTGTEITEFDVEGGFKIIEHDLKRWMQSFNNIRI